jgi:hypothetical protein
MMPSDKTPLRLVSPWSSLLSGLQTGNASWIFSHNSGDSSPRLKHLSSSGWTSFYCFAYRLIRLRVCRQSALSASDLPVNAHVPSVNFQRSDGSEHQPLFRSSHSPTFESLSISTSELQALVIWSNQYIVLYCTVDQYDYRRCPYLCGSIISFFWFKLGDPHWLYENHCLVLVRLIITSSDFVHSIHNL